MIEKLIEFADMTSIETCLKCLRVRCPNRIKDIEKIIEKYKTKMYDCPASIQHHHKDSFGYMTHVAEVLYIMENMLTSGMIFSDYHINVEEAFFVAFIHDLDKLTRYERNKQGDWKHTKVYPYVTDAKVVQMLAELGIFLSDSELHILAYHHGGWSAINNKPISATACFVHCADLISTKILDESAFV